jgi:uncharacterized protein YciI
MKTFEERKFYAVEVRLKKSGTKELPDALLKIPAYYQKLIDEGVYVAAGEFATADGGLVLLRAGDMAHAKDLAKRHPFHNKKFADLEVHEWSARWALWNLMGAGKPSRRRRR